ncbi:hypothetical protein LVD15_08075 [Fulvivirga maritima]|uniref:hypothetical protein n=1 Tax=Fulvivirga maritima TaxID=2904247 RepID=UPI001F1D6B3A|nr:hypothetical protein [Fulvivirga maritima]UII28374.1 hypothetical protein LVD15_08075 [Fulvivirga maritima]
MILIDNMNLNGFIYFFAAIIFGPPLLLAIIGFAVKRNSNKSAKVLFTLSALYLLVAGGICGTLLAG